MSKCDRWMPFNIGDYVADTLHLRTVEHGAYLMLMMHYWRHGPLPNDDGRLASITKQMLSDWLASADVMRAFFSLGEDGLLHHKRVDAELAKAREISRKRAEAGRRGGRPRRVRPDDGNAGANAKANAYATPKQTETPVHLPSVRQEEEGCCAERARPDAPEPVGGDDGTKLIGIFDKARVAAFGEDQARPWPNQKDHETANRWLAMGRAAGMTVDEVMSVAASVLPLAHCKLAGQGRQPVASLAYHDGLIAEAIADRKRPLVVPGGATVTVLSRPRMSAREALNADRHATLVSMGLVPAADDGRVINGELG